MNRLTKAFAGSPFWASVTALSLRHVGQMTTAPPPSSHAWPCISFVDSRKPASSVDERSGVGEEQVQAAGIERFLALFTLVDGNRL